MHGSLPLIVTNGADLLRSCHLKPTSSSIDLNESMIDLSRRRRLVEKAAHMLCNRWCWWWHGNWACRRGRSVRSAHMRQWGTTSSWCRGVRPGCGHGR